MRAITPTVLADLSLQAAATRGQVWRWMATTTGTAMASLGIDASLLQIHSENKAGTSPNYKGVRVLSMLCCAYATGEALAGMLRPGNAGANCVVDHFTVPDQAFDQLTAEIAVDQHTGYDLWLVRRAVQVRTDWALCSTCIAAGSRSRNIGFAVVPSRTPAPRYRALRAINSRLFLPRLPRR